MLVNIQDGDGKPMMLPTQDDSKETDCKERGEHLEFRYVQAEQTESETEIGKGVHGFVCMHCGGVTWADKSKTRRGA